MTWPPVPELLADLRSGSRTPTEVVGEALDRIAAVDDELGAFVTVDAGARKRARDLEDEDPDGRPLYGLPVAVKDNQATADLPTTCGSRLLEGHVPTRDHPVVERLREAGAVVVGKTNLAPFGLLALANNDLRGPTRNPWDLDRSPGGSSGGSAAAVAAGLVPAATGSDGGGSIRIPASWCGLPGLKPSRGRVPDPPETPMFKGLSVPGVLARTVAGTATLLDAVAGPHPRDPDTLPPPEEPLAGAADAGAAALDGADVAYSGTLGGNPVDPEVADRAREAADGLEAAGADVDAVDVALPDEQGSMVTKVGVEARTFLDDRFEGWEEELWAPLTALAAGVEATSLGEYVRANDADARLWRALEPVFREHDLLLTPTTAVPPIGAEEIGPDDVAGEAVGPLGWMPFTFPFNFTGQPAATVPAGRTREGLPVGLQIVGPPRADAEVLAAAAAYERERPWADAWPDLAPGVA